MTATAPDPGGIERWLRLTDGLGLDRAYVVSLRGLLPATRFAVDAYVRFVRERTLLEAIASSLTELFSPDIIAERVAGMLRNYDFVIGGHARLLHPAADPGAAGCRFRPRLREAGGPHPRTAGTGAGMRCASNATCCGRSSTRCTSPMSSPALPPPGAFRPHERRGCAPLGPRRCGCAERQGARPLGGAGAGTLFVPDEIALEVLRLVDGGAQRRRHRRRAGGDASRRRATMILARCSGRHAG